MTNADWVKDAFPSKFNLILHLVNVFIIGLIQAEWIK